MKNLLMIVVTLFLITSCQKEQFKTDVQNVPFKLKEFYPENLVQTKELIYDFVNTLGHGAISNRTNYPNTEINEGKWILEGAGNFLKNVNLNTKNDSETLNFNLTVENIIETGELKMKGSDMTNVFNLLLDNIVFEEANSNKIASGMDITIGNVTNTSTELIVTVLFEEDKVLIDPVSWELSDILINLANQNLNYGTGCVTYPSIIIFNNPSEFANTYCTEGTDINSTSSDCFYKEFIPLGTPDDQVPLYDALDNDAAVSLAIATEKMNTYLNLSPGQSAWPNYFVIKSLVKFKKQLYYQDFPFENVFNGIPYTIYTHRVKQVVIGGAGDCF